VTPTTPDYDAIVRVVQLYADSCKAREGGNWRQDDANSGGRKYQSGCPKH
jgi:hypothetical protein